MHTGKGHRSARQRVAYRAEALEPRRLLAAQLVADINPTDQSSNPVGFTDLNGSALFWANVNSLYRSDGTAAGTVLLHSGFGANSGYINPTLTVMGNAAYFEIEQGPNTDPGNPTYLWKTDGTPAGTQQVMQMPSLSAAPPIPYGPPPMAVCNRNLYFADSTMSGTELWRSDGTANGTQLVHRFLDDPLLNGMTYYNGSVYLLSEGSMGEGLWRTDGSDAGTTLVKSITTSAIFPYDASLSGLNIEGGLLYFTASNLIWRSDGTDAGTFSLDPSGPQTFASVPSGKVLFASRSSPLFETDGTNVTELFSGYVSPDPMVTMGDAVYFEGAIPGEDAQLWKTDGTSVSTVASLGVPFNSSGGAYFFGINTPAGPRVFFTAGSYNSQRWITDGTPAGTVRIDNGVSGTAYAKIGDRIFFAGADPFYGTEPFVTDGTAAGTHIVADLNTDGNSSYPSNGVSFGGTYYFTATSAAGVTSWWRSDGTSVTPISTPAGAIPGPGLYGPPVSPVTSIGDAAYFFGSGGQGFYRLDSSGITLLDNYISFSGSADFALYNGAIYFLAAIESSVMVFKTDGTFAGTTLVSALATNTDFYSIIAGGGYLYFSGLDPHTSQPTVWRSDDTPAGTVPIFTMQRQFGIGDFDNLTWFNNVLYFTWTGLDSEGNDETSLYRTDGMSAPTLIANFPQAGFMPIPQPVVANGKLYLITGDSMSANFAELWVTDGTGEPFVLLKQLEFGSGSLSFVTAIGSRVFFTAGSPAGEQLWVTDGTQNGTIHVSGPLTFANAAAAVPSFAVVDGQLLFGASDGSTGLELWRSAGTPGGTVRVTDIYPGGVADPESMAAIGNTVLFAATDRLHGRELWKINDTFSPVVWSAEGHAASVSIAFNEDVSGRLSAADFALKSTSTGVMVPTADIKLTYVPATNTAVFTWPLYDGGNLPAGNYQATLGASSVVDGAGNALAADEVVSFAVSTLSGTVFNDSNHNGAREPGEAGMAGVTVFLDANNDGVFVSGDVVATTDPNGNYTFPDVAPGTYVVRQVVPAGYAATAPIGYFQDVTVGGGKASTGPSFGDVLISSVPLDFSYLLILARHYGQPATFATGDLNGDGKVDFADLLILARNYGHALGTATPAAATSQPSSLSPWLAEASVLPVRRRAAHRAWSGDLLR